MLQPRPRYQGPRFHWRHSSVRTHRFPPHGPYGPCSTSGTQCPISETPSPVDVNEESSGGARGVHGRRKAEYRMLCVSAVPTALPSTAALDVQRKVPSRSQTAGDRCSLGIGGRRGIRSDGGFRLRPICCAAHMPASAKSPVRSDTSPTRHSAGRSRPSLALLRFARGRFFQRDRRQASTPSEHRRGQLGGREISKL